MDMSTSRKIIVSMAVLTLLFILLSVIQNTWLMSQFEKDTNYYLNQAAVEALELEINKDLLFLHKSGKMEEVEKLLKLQIQSKTKGIKDRLNDGRHSEMSMLLMNKALQYVPEDCEVKKPNNPLN